MSIYLQLLLLAAVVVYIVDCSGFTDAWLGWLSRFTARYNLPPVRSLRPFSCSKCMTWWTGIAWALIQHQFTLPVLAYIAGLSLLSITLCELFIFIRETSTNVLAKLNRWLND